ncbi:hypothetical protein VNO77_18109 [Canavalia gladiata]|uniref:Small RNA 2'-O-methyltransferase Hen1 La-motif C-terminal domain-containing protein n=1 Tax=Canavalia gladiata TaxID=3824 RepID=A0AAN9LK81_CANGL
METSQLTKVEMVEARGVNFTVRRYEYEMIMKLYRMMKSYKSSELNDDEIPNLIASPHIDFSSVLALFPLSQTTLSPSRFAFQRFDNVELDKIVEVVCDLPNPLLDAPVKEAFDVAYSNIYVFHAAQRTPESNVENIEPAQIAGYKTILLASPPAQDGTICKEILCWEIIFGIHTGTCNMEQSIEAVTFHISFEEYYLDVIANELGFEDAANVMTSRQDIIGEAILATIGYTQKSRDVLYEDVTVQLFYKSL